MEEMTEAIATEEATPTGEVEGVGAESAQTEETAGTGAETGGAEATPPPAEETEPAREEPTITLPCYRFNHQTLTPADEAEARDLMECGAAYKEQSAMREKLRMLADAGGTTPEALIDALMETSDQMLRERCLQEADGNEDVGNRLYEFEKSKRAAAHKSAEDKRGADREAERNAVNDRIAGEFAAMQEDFPELDSIDKVPESVIRAAAEKGIDLRDAYLRNLWSENKRREKNAEQQATASKAATGSQTGGRDDDKGDAVLRSMMEGLNAALW